MCKLYFEKLTTIFCVVFLMSGLFVSTSHAMLQDDDSKSKTESKEDDEQKDDKKENEDDKEAVKKPVTVTIEKQELRIFEKLKGVIQPAKMGEIITDVKNWSDLTIEKVVEQGAKVKSGEVVLAFDTEKLDDAIMDAEFAVKAATLGLEDAKLDAEQANVEFELNEALNEREMADAKDDFDYYKKVERKQRDENLDWSLKNADFSLEYAKEELDQLMKMYTEDELTEESEKIVLKRAQRSVESSERRLELQQLSAKRQKEASFPREDVRREDSMKRQELKYKKKKTTLPFARDRSEIAMKKAEFALKKAERKLSELQEDREKMELTSPMSGIIFHGRYANGKWTGITGATNRELETNKKLPAKKVALTVFDPDALSIRAEISEDKMKFFEEGTSGTAILKSDDSVRWKVSVKDIGAVPLASGARACTFEIKGFKNRSGKVLPTMNCTISVGVYDNKEALVAPKASVFSDDGFTHYVYLEDETRKEVEVGHTSGDKIEIKKGLSADDKILKAKP